MGEIYRMQGHPRRNRGEAMSLYFPAMPSTFRSTSRVFALALTLFVGCRNAAPPTPLPPAPPAEFVLAAGDSAFWVTSAAGSVRMRGAPLELARVDGRFYELYVADDDHSFEDANLIGQRVYRRDLVTGDSLVIFEDSVIPHLARRYSRLHPEDRPLKPDGEPNDNPLWSATSSLDLGDVQGPFVSFALHTDVERDDAPLWHTSRRGVLDIRRGGVASLATVAGHAAANVERQRTAELRTMLDSVRGSSRAGAARATASLAFYQLDLTSFALTTVDGAPAVAYALAGAGGGDAGHLIPLPPIRIGEPAWWPEVAASLPIGSADGRRDIWRHDTYEVVVRYDSLDNAGRLLLRDGTSREWTIGRVPGPATRIFWLDRPAIDSTARHALARAFEESSLYDEAVRTASYQPRHHRAVTPPRAALAHRRLRAPASAHPHAKRA
jgi:hypothetical protein